MSRPNASRPVVVGHDVARAQAEGRGVVALETSVIGQGLPAPRNLECVERMDAAIRSADSVPAWVGVLGGYVRVGLSREELQGLAKPGAATKVARRDLAMAVATGALGATTVSATIWAAALAGIAVSATGGIGGVHPPAGPSIGPSLDADVSADLSELARTPGLLVCSGPKSIIDPIATAERLEELGVLLVGFRADKLPFFLAREAPVELEHRVDDATAAAAVLAVSRAMGYASMILLCNPIPAPAAMDAAEVAGAAAEAEGRAARAGVQGKARTPFLLSAMAEITNGRSLEANLALLEENAKVAAEIAAVFSRST